MLYVHYIDFVRHWSHYVKDLLIAQNQRFVKVKFCYVLDESFPYFREELVCSSEADQKIPLNDAGANVYTVI